MSDRPIFDAIKELDVEKLKSLLENDNSKINAKNNWGSAPLHVACCCKSTIEIIECLLKYGADVNASCESNVTPLHITIHSNWSAYNKKENLEVAQTLIKYGADVKVTDENLSTPLCDAVQFKHNLEVVKLLLDLGVEVNIRNKFGNTPLHLAVLAKFVKMFIEHGADVNKQHFKHETPLYHAVIYRTNNSSEIVKILLENGADINFRYSNMTLLQSAIFERYFKNVQIILLYSTDFSFNSTLYRKIEQMRLTHRYEVICKSLDIIQKHLTKLKMFNLVKEDDFLSWQSIIITDEEMKKQYEENCRAEADRVKSGMICLDRRISFKDILTEKLRSVAIYLTVDEVRENLDNIEETFPVYANLLNHKIAKGCDLARSLNLCYKILKSVLGQKLPDTVSTQIVSLLTDDDLKILRSNNSYIFSRLRH